MKAKLAGQIQNLEKDKETGFTRITISCPKGKVSESADGKKVGPNAQDAMLLATLSVKTLVADQMKIGATITFTISDEEPNEGLT